MFKLDVFKKALGLREIGISSGTGSANMLFFATEKVPPVHLIMDFFDKVSPSQQKWIRPINYVLRERCHLEGWLEAFLRVEEMNLKRRFGGNDKTFEVIVAGDSDLSAVDIVFRLKTVGLKGYTEYRISILKIDEDEFLCVE